VHFPCLSSHISNECDSRCRKQVSTTTLLAKRIFAMPLL
jgi:hypothetical protein